MFLVRNLNGPDHGKLYAMKVLKKASIVQKTKTTEHTKTERQVLQAIRDAPFLITLHYAFQTDAKLHLILGLSFQFIIKCTVVIVSRRLLLYADKIEQYTVRQKKLHRFIFAISLSNQAIF